MKAIVVSIVVVVMLFIVTGCTTHIHNVGNGPQTQQTLEARQWYILWGLVPINDINTNSMAGNAADYQITTEYEALDILIGMVVGAVSVSSRTVTVTK